MTDQENHIVSEEIPQIYFTQIPNMVDDMDLDPYAFRLYAHLRRVIGSGGACWQSTNTLSEKCKMSVGKISESKQTLKDAGLIKIEKKSGDRGFYDHITLINIWPLNYQEYMRSCDESKRSYSERYPSHSERYPSHSERYASRGETKKNHVRRTIEEELASQIQNGANAPSDESLTSDDVRIATLNLADESFTVDSCPVCNREIVLKNLHKTKAVCPHCSVGLYVKNIDGEIVCKPPQSMREDRKRNRLIDLYPCPDEWKEIPYYARDKVPFKLLYDTEKAELLSALAWSVGLYTKGQMKYNEIVSAAIKAAQKRLSLKQAPTMSISDKAETSIERMARENGLTVQQVMDQLKVGGYVQS